MTQNRYYSATAQATTVADNPLLAGATTLNVGSTTGFPTSYPYTLVLARDTDNEEVVTVTAGAGTALTVTRGEDGTTAREHAQGVTVEHGVSARDFTEPQEHIGLPGAVHGLDSLSFVVGTTDAQTLENKTIDGDDGNTFAHIPQSAITGLVSSLAAKIGGANVAFDNEQTSESTSSTTYTDLTTVGPSVTVPTGPYGGCLLIFGARVTTPATAGATAYVSVVQTDPSSLAGNDANAFSVTTPVAAATVIQGLYAVVLSDSPNSTCTFKLQYRTTSGTATFDNRVLYAIGF